MKKIAILLLALLCAVILCACDDTNDVDISNIFTDQTSSSTTAPTKASSSVIATESTTESTGTPIVVPTSASTAEPISTSVVTPTNIPTSEPTSTPTVVPTSTPIVTPTNASTAESTSTPIVATTQSTETTEPYDPNVLSTVSINGITFKYPSDWDKKLSIGKTSGTLSFSNGETFLFGILFDSNDGDILGTIMLENKNVVLTVKFGDLDEESPDYEQNRAYQNGLNIILRNLNNDYDFVAGERVEYEDNSTFDIVTPVVTMKYPAKWKDKVTVSAGSDGVSFSNGNTFLFSILFDSEDGDILGTILLEDKNVVLTIKFGDLDKSSPDYEQNCACQEDINVILQNLMKDYEFAAGKRIEYEDNSTFDIVTPVVTMKYPTKWKDKVTVTVTSDKVSFANGNTFLFEILFDSNEGNLLGTILLEDKNVVLTVKFGKLDKTSPDYEQNCAYQDAINVIIQNLQKDYEFAAGERIEYEDSSTFDIVTPVVTMKYPAKWKNKITVSISADGVSFSNGNTFLFSILFDSEDGDIFGTLLLENKNVVLTVKFGTLDKSSPDYEQNSIYQEGINVILQNLQKDYEFFAGKRIEYEDSSTFDIVTPVVTMKYPAKWKDKVTVSAGSDGVSFSKGSTLLFRI
ncbi:MAG: PT domain-containing protein, partial [Clostridia bacterium]|nr:PT domain-containing protein [Clostridia bacterium]